MTIKFSPPVKYWQGKAPQRCDTCGGMLTDDAFTDGKTRSGPWAIMCDGCLPRYSIGRMVHHGQGLGQRYERQADGRWLKVAG